MDPVTHTLVGGSLAATPLGRTTRMASAALVIGANLPDIDVLSFANGSDAALAFRRGWTHGVAALLILPLLLAAALWWWGRRRADEGAGATLSPRWLLALCYLGVLTHPALDWLNTYGIRWWMPFDGTWYYGDSVFIVDPWLWLLLGTGWLIGRRPTWRLALLVMAPGSLLLFRVARSAPGFIPVIALLLLTLLAVLLWKPRHPATTEWAASVGLAIAVGFILAMITAHAATLSRVRVALGSQEFDRVDELMVSPMPANPFAWDVVFVDDDRVHSGRFDWLSGRGLTLSGFDQPYGPATDLWSRILARGEPAGFLGWARFPWIETNGNEMGGGEMRGSENGKTEIHLMDARYARVRTTGFGGATIFLAPPPSD